MIPEPQPPGVHEPRSRGLGKIYPHLDSDLNHTHTQLRLTDLCLAEWHPLLTGWMGQGRVVRPTNLLT